MKTILTRPPSKSDPKTGPSEPIFPISFPDLELILQRDGFAYTFIIVFMLINLTVFFLGAAPAWRTELVEAESNTIRLARAVARGGGAMVNLNASLITLVAAKSLMTYLRQTILNLIVPFDKAMPGFHSIVGNVLVVSTLLHVLGHAVRYSKLGLKGDGFYGFSSLASSGVVLTVCIIVMKLTSLDFVRKKSFETFHYVHGFGFVIFFVVLLIHGSHNGVSKTWIYVTAPLTVYSLDKIWRLSHVKRTTLLATKESVALHGKDVVCLRVPRSFSYLPGQYCDIKVPLVSNWQWHPFSIASSPHESEIRFYIKVNGNWTKALYNMFKKGNFNGISVCIRGPYGAPAQHVGQYERVVLISGGVGATPMCSISRYVHHWILNYTRRGQAASNTVSAAFGRNQSASQSTIITNSQKRTHFRHATRINSNAGGTPGNQTLRNQSDNHRQHLNQNISKTIFTSGCFLYENIDFERVGDVHGVDHVASAWSNDDVNNIDSEKRRDILYGSEEVNNIHVSIPVTEVPPFHVEEDSIYIMRTEVGGGITAVHSDLGNSTSHSMPEDYEEKSCTQLFPITDLFSQQREGISSVINTGGEVSPPNQIPASFPTVEAVNCSTSLMEKTVDYDDDMPVPCEAEADRSIVLGNALNRVSMEKKKAIDLEDGLRLEMRLMQNQFSASDAYKMMGMSSGPLAMMRYLDEMEGKKFGSSRVRDSMSMMRGTGDEAFWPDRMLFCLQSATINWFLVWLMLIRFSLIALGNITEQFTMRQTGLGIFTSVPFNTVDLFLALSITVPVASAVSIEIYMYGFQFFISENIGNSFDFFFLMPLLIACMALHGLNLAGVGRDILHVSKLTVFAIWPMLSLVLIWRIGRTIGSRVMLAQYFKSTHAQTKSFDYIWVSRTHEEDSWRINELLPLADSNIIRLHRFITKDKKKIEGWQLDYENIPLKTTYGRPNWDDVFGNLVNRSKSGAVIGIFFCGPDKMAAMIQSCAIKAMAISTIRAMRMGWKAPKKSSPKRRNGNREVEMAFVQSKTARTGVVTEIPTNVMRTTLITGSNGKNLGNESANCRGDASDPTAYGCGVRLLVRVENFT